jgi:UDP-glucose 4-epimerase
MGRVVLVTGVARYLGGRLAQVLQADPSVERVIGVDVVPPTADLGAAEFVRADIRNPIISKVISSASVDTVVHMSVLAQPGRAGGRTIMKEVNVIGTMQLLAACQKAPSVRKLVVKSSTTVYGASPKDPAMFTEDMEPRSLPRSGFAKDSVEVEGYVRGFARRRPDADVTVLRFANFLGDKMETPMSAYFELPLIPTVLGFDPRLQFMHPDDGLDCLRLCTVEQRPGTFNVAGDGVLTLSQAIRKTGRPRLPLPSALVSSVGGLVRRANVVDFSPEQLRFLTYGRGVDTTRMREVLRFRPSYSTVACFDDFVRTRSLNTRFPPQKVAAVEGRLLTALTAGSARPLAGTDG